MTEVPDAMPVTTPLELAEAMLVFELLHVPPEAPSVNVIFTPVQTLVGPEIVPAVGRAVTEITFVAAADPHELVRA